MLEYAKLRHEEVQALAAVTLAGAVPSAFIIWCNAMETAERQHGAERIAQGGTARPLGLA